MKYLLALLLLTIPTLSYADSEIHVAGQGTVSVAPDEAYISVTVQTANTDPSIALTNNTTISDNLEKSLGELNKTTLNTSDFSLQTRYKQVTVEGGGSTAVEDGYTVTNSLRVSVCDLTQLGSALGRVTRAGGKINGLAFGNSKAKEHQKIAREKAAWDARERAYILAKGFGLEKPLTLYSTSENSGYSESRNKYQIRGASADSDPNVAPSDLNFTVNITATFKVKD